MDRIRVCHVIHDTKCGGTEAMLLKLLGQLKDRIEFEVISLLGCGSIGNEILELGIPVHALHIAESGNLKPQRLVRLVQQLRKTNPHIVQTWGYHADLFGGVAAKLGTRARVLWNIRHSTLDAKLDSKNVLRSAKLCGHLSAWVPDRILLNAQSAIPVHQAAGYRREKMQLIPNGFDLQRFQPRPEQGRAIRRELAIPDEATVIGMCGRYHPHKGQTQFLQVAAQLASQVEDLHFMLAGRGCDLENDELVSQLSRKLQRSQVHLLGGRDDMPRVLNAMDVYLLPSLTEGMPNVIGEAMACGVPVVATDVGDASQLMGGHGTLVPPNDPTAMAKATSRLLEQSSSDRTKQINQARQHIAKNYQLDVIAEQYVKAWTGTLSQPRKFRSPNESSMKDQPPHSEANSPKLVHVTTIPLTQWCFLRGQFEFMVRQGFDVHAVSSPDEYLDRIQRRDPVTTHRVPISRKIEPVKDIKAAYALFQLFRKLQPEIVQLSTPKAALLGAIAATAAGVPVRIYQVRGLSSESETGWKRWLFRRFERLTAKLCNAHLVNAPSLLQYAQQAKILTSGRVAGQGMSNGVDLQRFHPQANPSGNSKSSTSSHSTLWRATGEVGSVIGYVGRLTFDKGLEDIYHAWTQLRNDYPKARLLLVGPWESENSVSRPIREALQNDERVAIPGPQDDVVPLYRCMDVFVYPSHGTEGFPNAPMEAAAMQLPVIATRVVGCVDAVADGLTGSITTPKAPEELEAQLRRYLSRPLLRQQHGQAGRKRIEQGFAPQDLWQEFHDFYIFLLRREELNLPRPESIPPAKRAA